MAALFVYAVRIKGFRAVNANQSAEDVGLFNVYLHEVSEFALNIFDGSANSRNREARRKLD